MWLPEAIQVWVAASTNQQRSLALKRTEGHSHVRLSCVVVMQGEDAPAPAAPQEVSSFSDRCTHV